MQGDKLAHTMTWSWILPDERSDASNFDYEVGILSWLERIPMAGQDKRPMDGHIKRTMRQRAFRPIWQ